MSPAERALPVAYSFESPLDLFQMPMLLAKKYPDWGWRLNDGEYEFYVTARPVPSVRLKIVEDGKNRFVFAVGLWPEALPYHAKVRDELLPLLLATNVQPADSPD